VIAERVLALSERYRDPVLVIFAGNLLGLIHGVQARHQQAREKLEQGIEACRQIDDRVLLASFVVDPIVSMRANLALPLMHLGLADQARNQIELAWARTEETGQPTARLFALWIKGMLAVRREEPHEVAKIAEELGVIVEKNMLVHGEGPACWLRGWAMAQLGEPREGYRLIRKGFDSHARFGAYAGNTETLGYAAQALMLAANWDAAEEQLDEMAALCTRIDEPGQACNLLLFRASVANARNEQAAARKFLNDALATARAQASPFHELRVLTAICARKDADAKDREALRNSYAALPEGRDTPMAQRAAALLSN
jgi:tetratricopeptide (TPR) repeat protein